MESDDAEEMCAILEARAKSILENFDQNYCETDEERAQKKREFVSLHEKHVDALKNGHRTLAHENFMAIINLSRGMEFDRLTKYPEEPDDHRQQFYLDARQCREGPIEKGYLRTPPIPLFSRNYYTYPVPEDIELEFTDQDIAYIYDLENVRSGPAPMTYEEAAVFRRSKRHKDLEERSKEEFQRRLDQSDDSA